MVVALVLFSVLQVFSRPQELQIDGTDVLDLCALSTMKRYRSKQLCLSPMLLKTNAETLDYLECLLKLLIHIKFCIYQDFV